MSRWILLVPLLLLVLANAGCGTMLASSVGHGDLSFYGGTQVDVAIGVKVPLLLPIAIADLPLSFVADTILLPVHAAVAYQRGAPRRARRRLDREVERDPAGAVVLLARTMRVADTSEQREYARSLLLRRREEALPALRDLLRGSSADELVAVVKALGPRACRAMARPLRRVPTTCQWGAILGALERLGDSEGAARIRPARGALWAFVRHEVAPVRRLRALGILHRIEPERTIALAVKDSSPEVRAWAIGEATDERTLVEASVDPSGEVRAAAFVGLLERMHVEPEILLPLVAQDPEEAVREAVLPRLEAAIEKAAAKVGGAARPKSGAGSAGRRLEVVPGWFSPYEPELSRPGGSPGS